MHIDRHRQAGFKCPNVKSRHKSFEYVNIAVTECAIASLLSYVQLILEASTVGSSSFVLEFNV